MVRATLEFPTLEALFRGFRVVCERLGDAVREVNDRYTVALPGGYRDLQLVVAHEGHLCELQLNTAKMIQAKKTKGAPARVESRCDAAAATRRFRGDESRRRRGCDVDSPWRRIAATLRPRRG